MRTVTVKLWQNNGTTTPGNESTLSVDGYIEELADKAQSVDGKDNLTKVTPSDITIKVLDPDGTIQTFLDSQLTIIPGTKLWHAETAYAVGAVVLNSGNAYVCMTAGTSSTDGTGPVGTSGDISDGTVIWHYTTPSGLLPPWLEIYVGGTRVFLGNVNPSQISRHTDSEEDYIELSVSDWSMSLSNTYLGCPTGSPWVGSTVYVVGQQCLSDGYAYTCVQSGTSAEVGGPTGTGSAIVDGTCKWSYISPTWQRYAPLAVVQSDPGSGSAWSTSTSNLSKGLLRNTFYANNPCAWISQGMLLTMTRPIMVYTLQTGVGLPKHPTPIPVVVETPPPEHCCLLPGTMIAMADGTSKAIELVAVGDQVISWDFETNSQAEGTVLEIDSPIRSYYYLITFEDRSSIGVTSEHPLKAHNGWACCVPAHCTLPDIKQLGIGSAIRTLGGLPKRVKTIQQFKGPIQVYNLSSISNYHCFFANKLLVHNNCR